MRPKFLSAAAFLSLLLGAGSVWWWHNSRTYMNQMTLRQSTGDSVSVYGSDGKLLMLHTSGPAQKTPQPTTLTWNTIPYVQDTSADGSPVMKWDSFGYSTATLDKGMTESSLVLPVWIVTGACAVLPMFWFNGKWKQAKKLAK